MVVVCVCLNRYLDAIVKQKRISDTATQQLLLDTYSIKTLLLHLPNLNPGEKEASVRTSPVYTKLINAKVSHVEVILKLVGTPEICYLNDFVLCGQMVKHQIYKC